MVGNLKKIQVFSALALAVFMLPVGAMAADYGTKATLDATKGLLPEKVAGASTVPEVVGAVVGVILGLLGIVFFALIFYAGFEWMTAQGSSEKVDRSKSTIISATIGLIIVLAAYAITNFVFTNLAPGDTSGSGSCVDVDLTPPSGCSVNQVTCSDYKTQGACSANNGNNCCEWK
ncbi:MAG: hypothetical protein AAB467_03530 [Patescibacteria group bacterium]